VKENNKKKKTVPHLLA